MLSTRPTYIRFHCEDLTSQLRFSFTALGSITGEVVFPGSEWSTPMPYYAADKTIYLQSPNAGVVVDIMEFEV